MMAQRSLSPLELIASWTFDNAGATDLTRDTGPPRDQSAAVVIRGHAFIQNLRRDHYELGVNARIHHLRVAAAFDELAEAI